MKPKVSQTFRRFLFSYLVILIIPNIAGYMTYRTSIDAAERNSIDTSLLLLKQSKDVLERRMSEVQNFTRQLAINQDITMIMNESVKKNSYNIYGLWKTWRDVSYYDKTNDFLQNYYIYLNNYDVVLTPATIYYRPLHYYELNHYSDLTFEEWKKTVISNSHQDTIMPLRPYIRNKTESFVITYIQSLPLNSFSAPKGTVVVVIDESKLSSMLMSFSNQYGGWAYITDKHGKTLASAGIDNDEIDRLGLMTVPPEQERETREFVDDTLRITIRSESSGWIYAAGIPRAALMEQANMIKHMTWTVTAAALAVGLLICLLLAYRSSTPINRLVRIVREQMGHDADAAYNDYDFLHGNIASLIHDNRLLETELNRQIPLVQDAFIKRLLRGEFHSLHEIRTAASQSGTEFQGDCGYVGIIRINGYSGMNTEEILNELQAARLLIKQTIRTMDAVSAITDLDSDKIAVIRSFASEPGKAERREAEKQIHELRSILTAEYRISVSISFGSSFHSPSDISRSFEEARRAMEHAAAASSDGQPIWYEEIWKETTTFYYPIDQEIRLLSAMKAGGIHEAKRIVDQIFVQNFAERGLSADMSQQLIGELKGTILKLIDHKAIHDSGEAELLQNRTVQLMLSEGVDQVRSELEDILEQICDLIARKKSENENETVGKIREAVEARFGDANFTLYQIADTLGRPEKYISQLFKEQTGEHISDYLEKIRIKNASALLFDSDLTIDEIAVRTGYNSSHSFRRAFKRVQGVSPSLYRQSASE
ncbi:helix-turn-helix domain-containing protein [Paenibacillus spongiae]|uniref:Helix-turn-helix domain-containing protein n=1 Tax=Paenibacillus spongiae TaxID=2909671 RepID=A0ABY5SAP8_9BACL|nr:helix-turn-helix domain-containing protein [Paenibacillus spongiae]UVI30992.1 helix-turn-helix domain-containing protein [Paenibacillus spongiae]